MDLSTSSSHRSSSHRRVAVSVQQQPQGPSSTSTAAQTAAPHIAAANSLQLLLAEDPSLLTLVTTTSGSGAGGGSSSSSDQVAFAYAANLLSQDSSPSSPFHNNRASSSYTSSSTTKERADLALQDVERKLALVESLAVKLSRTRPEAVAGHLLQLHGYGHHTQGGHDDEDEKEEEMVTSKEEDDREGGKDTSSSSLSSSLTLVQIRDRADRLERQAQVLDGVAQRVETSLNRGFTRLQATCQRLEHVLETSSTLKSLLRLTFESSKLLSYDTEDVRDLTRAAASTALVEELLKELPVGIQVVEQVRPQLLHAGAAVRQAAAQLLQQQQQQQEFDTTGDGSFSSAIVSLSQLGAILQVYYSLGELPAAVWKSVEQAHVQAEQISRQLLQTTTAYSSSSSSSSNDKRRRQARTEAAQTWAHSLTNICLQVWNLQRVLCGKSDPTTRQWFLQTVSDAPVPLAYQKYVNKKDAGSNTIWTLFWCRLCASLSQLWEATLGSLEGAAGAAAAGSREEVAALYPCVRAAAMELVGRLQETPAWDTNDLMMMSASGNGNALTPAAVSGSLGGGHLDDPFLEWSTTSSGTLGGSRGDGENPQAAGSSTSTPADTWTRPSGGSSKRGSWLSPGGGMTAATSLSTATAFFSTSAILTSTEWKTLEAVGLYPLQQAFLKACRNRLYLPLQYMFPEQTVNLDDDGTGTAASSSASVLTNTLLPSKYDIQRFDENIRQELSLADPRKEGGGDLTLASMIAECVCDMIAQFCDRAKTAVTSTTTGGDEGSMLQDWKMSESLEHDRKVAAIMYATAKYLKSAGDKTFVAPYRPAVSPQHEEAARICQAGLEPALLEIEKMVKQSVLYPLSRAINRRTLLVLAKMHHGVYIDSEDAAPSFVQKHLADALERIGQNLLSKFPPEYASVVASRVAAFSIYAFVSNAALLRPLGENARLHVTQDLADLELSLEQLVLKHCGGTQSLSQVVGKAYAELRAVRQMLFWSGLENTNASAQEITKALLREVWLKDVRPSTVFHYLFSFAPSLLSSPHHLKRMKAADYAATMVKLDGSVQDGDDAAWMTCMGCCDSYQQRASSVSVEDGDARVPQILISLGQELMRRRQMTSNSLS